MEFMNLSYCLDYADFFLIFNVQINTYVIANNICSLQLMGMIACVVIKII